MSATWVEWFGDFLGGGHRPFLLFLGEKLRHLCGFPLVNPFQLNDFKRFSRCRYPRKNTYFGHRTFQKLPVWESKWCICQSFACCEAFSLLTNSDRICRCLFIFQCTQMNNSWLVLNKFWGLMNLAYLASRTSGIQDLGPSEPASRDWHTLWFTVGDETCDISKEQLVVHSRWWNLWHFSSSCSQISRCPKTFRTIRGSQ